MLRKVLLALFLPLAMTAPVLAQTEQPPAETAPAQDAAVTPEVSAQIKTYVLKPVLDADGVPLLDEAGQPRVEHIAAEEGSIVPGDEVSYEVNFENTGEKIDGLTLSLVVSPDLALITEKIAASVAAEFSFTADEDPTVHPLFHADGQAASAELQAVASGSIVTILVKVGEVPKGEKFTVSYNAILR